MTELQMKGAIKAMKRFINESTSRVKGAKEFTKQVSKKFGTNVSAAYASNIYRAIKEWKWILTYMTESEFWDFARECVKVSDSLFVTEYSVSINGKISEYIFSNARRLVFKSFWLIWSAMSKVIYSFPRIVSINFSIP